MRARRGAYKYCAGLAVCLVFLSACSSPPPAPVDRRRAPPSERINYHVVSQGETLFSIAWRYEKDLHRLAAANRLLSPYTIYPGQRLMLDTSRVVARQGEPNKRVPRTKHQVDEGATKGVAKIAASEQKSRPSDKKPQLKSGELWSNGKWSWPVKGKVARRYNARALFKGIDIHSLPGSAVTPAAPGVIVYAGDGLRGYGKLIIIRHNSIFLSAYAHNRKIFVKEGTTVKSGQKIAEVGGDPANVRRFYFEIRKDGKPINPLNFLPRG